MTALLILYPALIYFGMQAFGPKILALLLIAMALLRLMATKLAQQPLGNTAWLLLSASLAGGLTMITGSIAGLKCYPIVVNLVLLGVFGISLWRPPSLIERLARLQTPELPKQAVTYTRKVTWVWCGFFLLNGSVATATVFASDQVWALYNGLLSYIAMGVMLSGEYLVRLRVQQHHKDRHHLTGNNLISHD